MQTLIDDYMYESLLSRKKASSNNNKSYDEAVWLSELLLLRMRRKRDHIVIRKDLIATPYDNIRENKIFINTHHLCYKTDLW